MRRVFCAALVGLGLIAPAAGASAANVPPVVHVDMTPEEMQGLYRRWREAAASQHFDLLGVEADKARAAGKKTIDDATMARVLAETMRLMKAAADYSYTGCLARGVAGPLRCKQIFDVSMNALFDWAR